MSDPHCCLCGSPLDPYIEDPAIPRLKYRAFRLHGFITVDTPQGHSTRPTVRFNDKAQCCPTCFEDKVRGPLVALMDATKVYYGDDGRAISEEQYRGGILD